MQGWGQNAAVPSTKNERVRSFRIKRAFYSVDRSVPQPFFFGKEEIYNLTYSRCTNGSRGPTKMRPVASSGGAILHRATVQFRPAYYLRDDAVYPSRGSRR